MPTPGPVPRIRRHRAPLSPLPPRARRWHPCPCLCPLASCLSGTRGVAQPDRVFLSPVLRPRAGHAPRPPPPPCPPDPSVAELPTRTSPGLVPAARGVTVTVTVTATGRHGATSAATAPQGPARAVTRSLSPAPPPAPCHPHCHLNCHMHPVTHNLSCTHRHLHHHPRLVTCTCHPQRVTHVVPTL